MLLNLLEGLQDENESGEIQTKQKCPKVGIGMDASITPLKHQNLCLVQTTDFFYPLVDDPYMQGKIACANVLSDLYAMGVIDCDHVQMLLAPSSKMTDHERDVILPLMIQGFKDTVQKSKSKLNGIEIVINPWLTIGGVATSVCHPADIIMPESAVSGDVLILTKPLGTQVAVNAHQWIENPDKWNRIKEVVTKEDVNVAYNQAMQSMARINLIAAKLMHKYGSHAATDVTGFGILGHAKQLAQSQKEEVSFIIHTLPIISKMTTIAKACGSMFKLLQGYSAETSGGLLICLPRIVAHEFCDDIEKQEGRKAWVIGDVVNGSRDAKIVDSAKVIEVPVNQHW